jgi:Flp pilus assembly protein TadG
MKGGIEKARRERGQAMVELAISSLALLLLVGGMIDLGRAFEFSVAIHNAAYEGARHGAWYEETRQVQPYLYDAPIKSTVDDSLRGGGLPASVLRNSSGAGAQNCPGSASSNYNPPYADSFYPTSVNQPWLYICYNNSPSTDYTTAPTDNSRRLQDLNVVVLLSYGPMNGTFQDQVGSTIHLAANWHVTVQGHP